MVQPWLQRQPRRREREAALPLGRAPPRYLLFSNPRRRNRWGHRRTFRLQLSSHAGPVLPRGWREERGVTWARCGTGGPGRGDGAARGLQHRHMCHPWGRGVLSLVTPPCWRLPLLPWSWSRSLESWEHPELGIPLELGKPPGSWSTPWEFGTVRS